MSTHVAVVLDESGSMSGIKHATYTGFNEYIQDLRREDTDRVTVSLTKFNFHSNVVYTDKEINDVPLLNDSTYIPNGGTALYDAIAFTVAELAPKVKDTDRAVVVVLTDGYENSSRETSQQQILDLIQSKEAEDNWTFAYLGANQDAWAVGATMGFAGGNTMAYMTTDASVGSTYSHLAGKTNALRSSPVTASANFLADEDEEIKGRTKGSTSSKS